MLAERVKFPLTLSAVCFVWMKEVLLALFLVVDLPLAQELFVFEMRSVGLKDRETAVCPQIHLMKGLRILLVSLTHELPVKNLEREMISVVLALAR